MINWVEVLRRIMHVYHIKTLRELGMALGVSLRPEDNGPDIPLPWTILEMVVSEKRLSWDWLLTGRHFQAPENDAGEKGGSEAPKSGQPFPHVGRPPRLETRELARTLLDHHPAEYEPAPEPPSAAVPPPSPEEVKDEVVRELEDIRATMQKELERVERILSERRINSR